MPLPTRRSTIRLGRAIAEPLRAGDVVILEGPLGAGKTFLARAICRGLGVPVNVPITSPTFSLVHELEGRLPIAHADLYRIGDEEELWHTGLRDLRAAGSILLVEWGGPFEASLGGDALRIALDASPRRARVWASGPESEARLAALP